VNDMRAEDGEGDLTEDDIENLASGFGLSVFA
jgi:hypothetical protein